MWKAILSLIERRRAPMLEAERIVYYGDGSALRASAGIAADTWQDAETRLYHARVLTIAIERKRQSDGVDRRTRDCLYEEWESRRGSLIG